MESTGEVAALQSYRKCPDVIGGGEAGPVTVTWCLGALASESALFLSQPCVINHSQLLPESPGTTACRPNHELPNLGLQCPRLNRHRLLEPL